MRKNYKSTGETFRREKELGGLFAADNDTRAAAQATGSGKVYGAQPTQPPDWFKKRAAPPAPAPPKSMTRGTQDRDTSHAAAAICASGGIDDLNEKQRKVFNVMREYSTGITDDELRQTCARRFQWLAESTARKRRCELRDKGLVIDTGERSKAGATGAPMAIWALSPLAWSLIRGEGGAGAAGAATAAKP